MSSPLTVPLPTIGLPAVLKPLPLQPGDHLTAAEFHRRYLAMPESIKAELIDGVVYMPSPVSIEGHGSPHADFSTWLGTYRAFTPGAQASHSAPLVALVRGVGALLRMVREGADGVVLGFRSALRRRVG